MHVQTKLLSVIVGGILFSLMIGCDSQNTKGKSTTTQTNPTQPQVQNTVTTQKLGEKQGRVQDIIDVDGYTYVLAENSGHQFWLAGPPITLQKGEIIGWDQAIVMSNFTSKSLNRTFERILFVSNFTKGQPTTANPIPTAKVVSVTNAGSYTYINAKHADGESFWLAVPQTTVNVNDNITWQGGSVMQNFTSKSLNRTFNQIIFTGGVKTLN